MLINSANLMGQGADPLPYRGFGRIHLEAGMPLNGEGDMALFVQESELSSDKLRATFFEVDADAELELRATLSWTDPAGSTSSVEQLVNNMDIRGESGDGGRRFPDDTQSAEYEY